MARPLYAEITRPADARSAWASDVLLIAGFSLVIGLCAQIAIPLPFTPVPVTLQTLAVLVAAGLLGSARAAAAVLAYIGEGFAGLPVFSGGRAGVAHLLGPTGGYLVGFVIAAFLVGLLVERGAARSWLATLSALVAGTVLVYVPGVLWLGAFTGMGKAFSLGVTPFLIGDALKIIVGCGIICGISLGSRKAHST
jgi:biotin transport system substrate-specific component